MIEVCFMPRLFVFGLGYSASRLVKKLLKEGWEVAGTWHREPPNDLPGVALYQFDREHPLKSGTLAGFTHLLSSIPPDAEGDPALDLHGPEIKNIEWIGYLSTTGVYGTRDGDWVDEDSELLPTQERSKRRAAAEKGWMALSAHIFRLAGIYGPGRSILDDVRSGVAKRIDKPGHVFSRIHVEDISNILKASMAKPNPGRIYNLCDDDPAQPAQTVVEACRLLNAPLPPLISFAEAGLSPMALTFWADNKRVSNERIKKELGVKLAYPNYREGLAAILEKEGG
jgi:nucleoside-diphosphate-sugar epimerase